MNIVNLLRFEILDCLLSWLCPEIMKLDLVITEYHSQVTGFECRNVNQSSVHHIIDIALTLQFYSLFSRFEIVLSLTKWHLILNESSRKTANWNSVSLCLWTMVEIRKADTFEKKTSLSLLSVLKCLSSSFTVLLPPTTDLMRDMKTSIQTSHEVQVLNNRTYRDNILLF